MPERTPTAPAQFVTPVPPAAGVPPSTVASAGASPAGPMPDVSSSPLPAVGAAGYSVPACAHICSPPSDAPEHRAGPADLSLPELLARVVRESPAAAPAPHAPVDRTSLATRALAGLPTGIRLWLAKEGLSSRTFASFKGLALLNAHLSGKSFASLEQRLDCIAELLESHGVEAGLLRHPTYGIRDDWGRSEYHFSDDVSALNTVLAAVDEFVTLCDGPLPSPWMSYGPLAHFTEAKDWQTGMPHRPLERAQWSRIPGGSRWANHMLKYHFAAVPKIPVRSRISKNCRSLRPRDPLFDPQQSNFVRRKLSEELQQRVVSRRRLRPAVTSAILCVPKEGSSDKYRKVEHMSHFKENFEKVHFKMETMSHFPTIFGPGFFLFKLDFKAAYHNFLVRSTLRDLFGVEFEGEFYTYNALPFGFRLSAYWLHRMVKVVATFLRSSSWLVWLACSCPRRLPSRCPSYCAAHSLSACTWATASGLSASVSSGRTSFGRRLMCGTSSNGSSFTCSTRTAAVLLFGLTPPSRSCPQPARSLSFRRTLRTVALVGSSTARTPRLSPLLPSPRCFSYAGSTSLDQHPAVQPSCVPMRSTL